MSNYEEKLVGFEQINQSMVDLKTEQYVVIKNNYQKQLENLQNSIITIRKQEDREEVKQSEPN